MKSEGSNTRRFDIILFQKFGDFSTGVVERLHGRGFGTTFVASERELFDSLESYFQPVILVNSGEELSSAESCREVLLRHKALHSYPVVIVGPHANKAASTFERLFPICLILQDATGHLEIVRALDQCVKNYPSLRARLEFELERDRSPYDSGGFRYPPEEEIQAEIATDVVTEIERLSSFGGERLGGDRYPAESSLSSLEQKGLFPHSEHLADCVREHHMKLAAQHSERLCRVAEIHFSLGRDYIINAGLEEESRVTALTFARDLCAQDTRLLTKDYFLMSGQEVALVASAFRKTASELQTQAGSEASLIVELMAVIAERVPADSETLSAIPESHRALASSIFAADMLDRICFSQGYWDGRKANRLFRRVRRGELGSLHPEIVKRLLRYVCEAGSKQPKLFVISKQARADISLSEEQPGEVSQEPEADESKVEIDQLAPGMRLRRPVKSYDGQVLVQKDILLDTDLIWRIWEISTVNPVYGPLFVAQDNTKPAMHSRNSGAEKSPVT